MKICQACKQFENRVKQWNRKHGVTDPLPYIDEMIKTHKHLFFEERRRDGAGCLELLFRCLKCSQCWELLSWAAVGQLDVRPHFPKYHSSPSSP